MRTILILLLALTACDNAPLRVYSDAPLTDEQIVALDDASDLLGHEIVLVDRPYGAVEIVWWDDAQERDDVMRNGWTGMRQYGCTRLVESIARGSTLAHEIGHAFRLDHVADPEDLMFAVGVPEREFFGEQETLDRRINRFAACTP